MIKRYLSVMVLMVILTGLLFCPVQAADPEIEVRVDPGIELLSAVQLLSGYFRLTDYDLVYKQEMMEYFSPFRDHPAVKLFSRMADSGFTYDAPPTVMLYLSAPPALDLKQPFSEYLKRRAGGEKRLEEFIQKLRDFAVESNFMDFYNDHRQYYDYLVVEVENKISGNNYAVTLEDYYRTEQAGYSIILAPLFHAGGYGPKVEGRKGSYNIYNICGPLTWEDGYPGFGDEQYFRYLAWHEFSHSFVNPTTELYRDEVDRYSSLYLPISERMREQAYGSWEGAVNEHLVRAVTTRLTYLEYGKEAGDRVLLNEKRRGFAYLDFLIAALKRYENHPEKYSSFREFYPEVIKVFKGLSEQELDEDFFAMPFAGPINNAFQDRDSIILIRPTNEADKKTEEKIYQYIVNIKKTFFREAVILTDKEALKTDLSSNSILVSGTIKGNLWLKKHLSQLPFSIERHRIIADKVYQGNNLRFITAWPNPQNQDRGMVIYTAQQAEDVIGINSVFHGPTDYVIARGEEVIQSGKYKKIGLEWKFY